MRNFKSFAIFLWLVAAGLTAIVHIPKAEAVVVNATTSAFFQFDVTGVGPTDFTGFIYVCGGCNTVDFSDPERLAIGATFDMRFGSTFGASDLGTDSLTNIFTFNLRGHFGALTPTFAIPLGLTTIFAEVRFVDDPFGITTFGLNTGFGTDDFQSTVDATAGTPTVIPLPAALPLFLTGLAGLALIRRRQRQA